MQYGFDINRFDLLSRSLGHHVRSFSFDLPERVYRQARIADCVALMLPNLSNIRYLLIGCNAWRTVTDSAIINGIANLQHLKSVAFGGLGFIQIDEIYSPSSPTFFDTLFNKILSSHAEQLTSLSLESCPFHCTPGTFELIRENLKNLQVLALFNSLPRCLWQVFAQPVTWACADRLVMLDIASIHSTYVPILVEHIVSGRFGNLKRLEIDMQWSDRDRNIVIAAIEWNIRPLDMLVLNYVPRLELEIFGCLYAKQVHVMGVPQQAMIELVHGGGFKEMTVLRIWQRDWEPIWLEQLASACANRNAELLFQREEM